MATRTPSKRTSKQDTNGTTLDVMLRDPEDLTATGEPEEDGGLAGQTTNANLQIKPLNQQVLAFYLRSSAPYMQHRFSQKAKNKMMETQRAGSQARSKRVREPRDFAADCYAATYRMPDGSYGLPCGAFRNGMISACKAAGYYMTKAKLAVFILADGYDELEGTPLVKLYGEPVQDEKAVRNETGVIDIRSRPRWSDWKAILRVRFDADLLSGNDIGNLLVRMGAQVGIGEGRPDSKRSNGMDYGMFDVVNKEAW